MSPHTHDWVLMPHGYYVVLKRVGLSEAQHFIFMRRLKRTNSKKKLYAKERINFWSHILWYSAPFVFRKTTHVREMSVSYQLGQLEASCTKQPGHLLLTTSPRTRGQGGQGSGAAAAAPTRGSLDLQCPFPAVAFRSGWPRQLLSLGLKTKSWFGLKWCLHDIAGDWSMGS